jgi:hypothetical protein
MPVLTEGRYPAEFLMSEANQTRSRDSVVIASGAGIVRPGMVLGRITTGGKFVPSPNTGSDGSQVAVAIALYEVDATSADQRVAVISRDAEVNTSMLLYAASVDDAPKRAAKATQLAAVGIITR